MIEVIGAVTMIDALAGAHTATKNLAQKWKAFTTDYLPPTIDTPDWYRELRCRLLHNQSAGPGMYFSSDTDAPHGAVLPSGGTVIATGELPRPHRQCLLPLPRARRSRSCGRASSAPP